MSLTLAITDNGDGTGGVATVAGGGVSDSNTLDRATWTGQAGALTWTSVGSRTGNGTIAIAVAAGFYLFRLTNVASGVTTFVAVYQPLTDSTEKSAMERTLDAAVLRVQSLGLTVSGTAVSVERRWLPRAKPGDTFPFIAVHPVGAESFLGTMTATDDIGLPFAVSIIDKANQDPTANLSRDLLWREQILSALRYQRLAGVPESWIVNPEPGMVVNPGLFDSQNLIFSPLIFRAVTRTERG